MINQVTIMGNLTKNVEAGYTHNGKAYARFTVAVNNKMLDKQESYFINCVAWSYTAENIAHLTKGEAVLVNGEIVTGSYEKNGQRVYTVDVRCRSVAVVPRKNMQNNQGTPTPAEFSNFDNFGASDNSEVPF